MDTKHKTVREWLGENPWIIVVVVLVVLFGTLAYTLLPKGYNATVKYYEVETYDELKKTLKKYEDILYPDLSRYEKNNMSYAIEHKPRRPEKKTGYTIGMRNNQDFPEHGTALWEFEIYCIELSVLQEMREDRDDYDFMKFKPNMQLEGIPLEHTGKDMTNSKNAMAVYGVAPQTFLYKNEYIFEYQGCQYRVSGLICLLPEEQIAKDPEQEVRKGDDELLEIIKSIIRQREEREWEN